MPAKKTATKRKSTPTKKSTAAKKNSSAKKSASPKTRAASTKAKSKAASKSKAGDKEVTIDRRTKADRRDETAEAAEALAASTEQPQLEKREKVQRRRQIDPTTCERDYSEGEVEFMNAMDEYKRTSGRMFPTCSEVLEVIRDLGYVQLTPAEIATVRPEPVEEISSADEVSGEEMEVPSEGRDEAELETAELIC